MASRRVLVELVAKDLVTGTLKRMRSSIATFGATILASFGAAAIARQAKEIVTNVVSIGVGFENSLAQVAAVSGATKREMQGLQQAARDLGKKTVFSASQAGEALEKFALAGFTVNEMLGAIQPTLNLAAAGLLNMEEAASIIANTMRSMGLTTADLNDVVDALSFTASNSNQTVSDLGEAFKFVAPAARILGSDIYEVNAALGILANQGILGSMAGTGLRRVFTGFLGDISEGASGLANYNVQLKDAEGNFVGLAEAIRRLKEAGVGPEDAFDVFGLRGGQIAAILLNEGAQAVERFEHQVRQSMGNAAEISAKRLDSLQGDFIKLKSALQELAIQIYEGMGPLLRQAIQDLTNFALAFGESEGAMSSLVTVGQQLAFALLELTRAFLLAASASSIFAKASAAGVKVLTGTSSGLKETLKFFSALPDEMRNTKVVIDAVNESMKNLAKTADDQNFERYIKGIRSASLIFTDPKTGATADLSQPAQGPPAPFIPTPEPEVNKVAKEAAAIVKKHREEGVKLVDIHKKRLPYEYATKTVLGRILEQSIKDRAASEEIMKTRIRIAQLYRDMPIVGEQLLLQLEKEAQAIDQQSEGLKAWLEWREEQREAAEDVQTYLLDTQTAIVELITFGSEKFRENLEKNKEELTTLGQDIRAVFAEFILVGVQQFSVALVEAATGGDVNFKEMIKNLLKGLAAAIIQALILKAIMASTGFGAFLGFSSGGVIPRAANGLVIPGHDTGRDRVPVMVRPGEAVLPKSMVSGLMSGGGTGGGTVIVNAPGAFFADQEAPDRIAQWVAEANNMAHAKRLVSR